MAYSDREIEEWKEQERERHREYRRKNREKYAAYQRARYHRLKAELSEYNREKSPL